jgi:hypothetical protein
MSIKQHKIEHVLSKQYNYGEDGILTRKEFISLKTQQGYKAIAEKVINHAAETKVKEWLSANAWNIPFGNYAHPKTIEYNEEKQRLEDRIYKTNYYLANAETNVYHSITKTEFDYINSNF